MCVTLLSGQCSVPSGVPDEDLRVDFEGYQLKPGEKEEKRREFLEPPVGWDPKKGGTYKVEVLKVE